MARITNITFAQVAQIADGMKAAGHRPTARALRERIGSGSMGTIHKLLQQYNGNQCEEREAAELPESIATALMDFIQTEIATACEPYQQTEQEIKEAVDAMAEENERLEEIIDRLQRERDEAERKQNACAALLCKCESEFEQVKNELRNLELNHREKNLILDRTIERCRRLEEQAEQGEIMRQLAEEYSAAKLEAEKQTAVMAAKLEAAEERAADRSTRADAAERRAETTAAEARTANAHYQACAARLEEAARTIDELKKKAQPSTKVSKTKTTKPAQTKAAE